MKRYIKFIVILVMFLTGIIVSSHYTRLWTQKNDMLMVLNWLNAEYDLVILDPSIKLDGSSIVLDKLLIVYSSGLDSSDLDGYAQKAICKMYHDTNLRDRISKEPDYIFLQNYLDKIWDEIKHSFNESSKACELLALRKR